MGNYDIAIIGMGCVFPRANNVEQYWQNILTGESYIKEMPKNLWHMENFYSPDHSRADKSYTKVGSFIEGFEFPFLEYRLPPKAMQGMDPAQLVTLEPAEEVRVDGGNAVFLVREADVGLGGTDLNADTDTADEVVFVWESGAPGAPANAAVSQQLAATHVARSAVEVVELVHSCAGTAAIRNDQPFQRHFRDAHVIAQHAFLSEARLEAVGQVRFGLEPDWGFFYF